MVVRVKRPLPGFAPTTISHQMVELPTSGRAAYLLTICVQLLAWTNLLSAFDGIFP